MMFAAFKFAKAMSKPKQFETQTDAPNVCWRVIKQLVYGQKPEEHFEGLE